MLYYNEVMKHEMVNLHKSLRRKTVWTSSRIFL